MRRRAFRFSPLAQAELEEIWTYSFERFGGKQADRYLDGLFEAIKEAAATDRHAGVPLRHVPRDLIADITNLPIRYLHFGGHYVYFRSLSDGALGVVCILGDRTDTPRRLKEQLSSPLTEME